MRALVFKAMGSHGHDCVVSCALPGARRVDCKVADVALRAVVLLANKVDVVDDYDALYAGQVAGVAVRCATSAPTKATRNSSLFSSLHNGHLTLLLCQAE